MIPKKKKMHLRLHFVVAFRIAFRFYTADPVVWAIYSTQKKNAFGVAFRGFSLHFNFALF
jgi:hypothetical protein